MLKKKKYDESYQDEEDPYEDDTYEGKFRFKRFVGKNQPTLNLN